MNQQQPPAPEQPQPSAPGHPVLQPPAYMENPGQTLGIIGFVLNLLGVGIGGIVLGAVSRSKSKQAGMSTVLGTISLVWGIVLTILTILMFFLFLFLAIVGAPDSPPINSSSSDNSSIYSTN